MVAALHSAAMAKSFPPNMATFLWSPSQQRAGSPALQKAAGLDVDQFEKFYGDGKVLEEAIPDLKPVSGLKAEWKQAARISKTYDPSKPPRTTPFKLPPAPPRVVEAISTLKHDPKIDPNTPH